MPQDLPQQASLVSETEHEEAVLKTWYAQPDVLDLTWLAHPSRHHVRWRQPEGRWVMAKRRFSGGPSLQRHLVERPPADLYVSTSAWLNPVNLPGLRDETKPAPVLLDHLVVFDLDLGPFSRKRLEEVRQRTSKLILWLEAHTDLALLHVSFSGAKGFHVVLSDPDRTPFAEPDTRRIIRVPGSLHGRTKWACTVLPEGQIHRPLRTWVMDLPKADSALPLPRRPPREPKQKSAPKASKKTRGLTLGLEVSTHVVGTKDRTAVVALLPSKVNDQGELERTLAALPDDVAPLATFEVDGRYLLVAPRAFPRSRAIAVLEGMGLKAIAARHRADEHAWIPLLKSEDASPEGITPLGWSRLEDDVGHPWSRPHLELCHRLGLDAPPSSGDISGSPEPALRFAKRR
jgi:hypothetical protein